ncbi:MAG: hypothetical protein A3J93_01505 [Candidatus Magasanikbacteria bacterium RIFOXYC2_FULL_42_28]|uniref:Uncharacterized protein n=1 Tax=Candidatus Magasanikbacteria bacterium RIFOXYC2_FULL_42_28 TaxID=1798704 RepID=A0A1F6NXU6_9BACT|nr:MAG: hypothetical protein A3J93_01505 [Candidatus Magasanikbacteria bacterium RIFOXYC2_FULL_42_28]
MAAKRFTSGQLREFAKLMGGLFKSLEFNIEDVQNVLTSKEFWAGVKTLVVGVKSPALATGLVPTDWTVVEDVVASQFDVASLRPRAFLKAGESGIAGDEMRRRAVSMGANLGLADGQRILAEQDKLSAEFRGFYIPLAGTVLCDSDGLRRVACLRWHGDRWVLRFSWLGCDWRGGARFACRE